MAMRKATVTINFSKSGIQPPLYLAGSFSDPAWQPKPMQFTVGKDDEYQFHTEIRVEGGSEYQYKFRVGDGDYWVLDDDALTVTDDQGNQNNLLAIPLQQKPSTKDIHQPSAISTHHMSSPLGVVSEINSQRKSEVGGAGQHSRPALIVEKTDAEPRHGDNFGEGATADQKEAHRIRSLDAEPDQVIIADKATANSASTAAEVADVAATLDIQQPTPPIPDAEAGRIGFRRLSQTPIADVASVASEVSDSAALLDTDEPILRIEMPPPFTINGTNTGCETPESGEVTPWEDRAPRFAYECVELPHAEERIAQPHEQYRQSSDEDEGSIDLNDPTIEDFPCERHLILERVRTSATRLSQDETVFEGVSAGPVGTTTHQPEHSDSSSSPGRVAGEARTPSLDSIPEEHAYEGETFSALPSALHQTHDQPQFDSVERSQPEVLATHKEEPESSVEAYEPNSTALLPGAELTQNAVPARTSTHVRIQGTICDAHTSRQLNPDSKTMSVDQTMDGANTEAERFQLSPNFDDSSQTPMDAKGYEESRVPGTWPIASNASPGSNLNAQAGYLPNPSVTDSATSSAIEGSSTSQLKNRKTTSVSPVPERPLTPSSVSSTNIVAKSRNLLKNFLRLIFLDWIGGMIKRLCGRRRRT